MLNAIELYNIARIRDDKHSVSFCNFLFNQAFRDRYEFLTLLEMECFTTQEQFLEYLKKYF